MIFPPSTIHASALIVKAIREVLLLINSNAPARPWTKATQCRHWAVEFWSRSEHHTSSRRSLPSGSYKIRKWWGLSLSVRRAFADWSGHAIKRILLFKSRFKVLPSLNATSLLLIQLRRRTWPKLSQFRILDQSTFFKSNSHFGTSALSALSNTSCNQDLFLFKYHTTNKCTELRVSVQIRKTGVAITWEMQSSHPLPKC